MSDRVPFLRVSALAAAGAALLDPGAASAQDLGACGQTAVLTEAFETPLVPGFEPVRRILEIHRNEPRYLEFRLDQAQEVTIRTEAQGMDPAIALLDDAGEVVAWDDDGGSGLDAMIAAEFGAGRYCVQVRSLDAQPISSAAMMLVLESGLSAGPSQVSPCSDPETTRTLAVDLDPGIDPILREDVTDPSSGRRDFRLSIAETVSLMIELGSGEFDTILEVLGPTGEQFALNDDFAGTDSRIAETFPPGEYCVSVAGFAGSGGGFALVLSETEIETATEPCGDPGLTRPLSSGFGRDAEPVLLQGDIDPDLLESWFSLTVTEDLDLRLDARSGAIDTVLELLDATGAMVAENDDGPDGTDSRIEAIVGPGDYCVVVRSFDGDTGSFDLTLVPAGMEPPPREAVRPDPAAATAVEDMGILGDTVRSYTIGGEATLWASFVLETPASVTVSGMSISSDFSIAVFAEDGTPVGAAGPVAALSPAEVSDELGPGTYLVALTNHGGEGMLLRQITVTRD